MSRRLVLESLTVAYLMERPSGRRRHSAGGCLPRHVLLRRAAADRNPLAHLTRAEFLQLRGMSSLASALAREILDQERDAQRPLTMLLASHLLARVHPSAEMAETVVSAAERCDFELATTYAEHASAAVERDAAGLEQVAKIYDDLGLTWLAALRPLRPHWPPRTTAGPWPAGPSRPSDWSGR